MKPTDRSILRLLKAAANAPLAAATEMPFKMEGQVLAAWRKSRSVDSPDLLRFFRVGFACACVFLLITAAISWTVYQNSADDFAMPTAALKIAMSP